VAAFNTVRTLTLRIEAHPGFGSFLCIVPEDRSGRDQVSRG
jgi:hypothetical protein